MSRYKPSAKLISIIFMVCLFVLTPEPVFGQRNNVNNDWKLTRAGTARMVVYNRGRMFSWETDFPGLVDVEYPPGSSEEHIGACGMMLGGKTADGVAHMSAGDMMKSVDEFWPSSARWDSIWTITREDGPVDIGGLREDGTEDYYLPGYTAISDEDLVCRYNDYNILNPTFGGDFYEAHTPLYADIIQIVYTWATPPLSDVILYTYKIIPTRDPIHDAIFGFQYSPNIGLSNLSPGSDDRMTYDERLHMVIGEDSEGGTDGVAQSHLGFMTIPGSEIPETQLTWSWVWSTDIWFMPDNDAEHYEQVSNTGSIMRSQLDFEGGLSIASLGVGDIALGDTLTVHMALVFSEQGTVEGIIENADVLMAIRDQNFRVPVSPPTPPLQIVERSREVTLDWTPTAGVNPETYTDDARLDEEPIPFEGYRLYKSTISSDGPWTLLAEYDLPDNDYGANSGLEHSYTDIGLLNNVDYYYAVTAFSKPDKVMNWPSSESSVNSVAQRVTPGTATPETVGKVAAVPNPYRADVNYRSYNPPWEQAPPGRSWMPNDRRMQFINLPAQCEISIYTSSGDFVYEIQHDDVSKGYEDWNLTSYSAQSIASGLYIFTAEDMESGEVQVGKFVIIK